MRSPWGSNWNRGRAVEGGGGRTAGSPPRPALRLKAFNSVMPHLVLCTPPCRVHKCSRRCPWRWGRPRGAPPCGPAGAAVSAGVSPSKQTPPGVPPCLAGAAGLRRAWGGPRPPCAGLRGDTLCFPAGCNVDGGSSCEIAGILWQEAALGRGRGREPHQAPGSRPTDSGSPRARVQRRVSPGAQGGDGNLRVHGSGGRDGPREGDASPSPCPCLLTLNRGSWFSGSPVRRSLRTHVPLHTPDSKRTCDQEPDTVTHRKAGGALCATCERVPRGNHTHSHVSVPTGLEVHLQFSRT